MFCAQDYDKVVPSLIMSRSVTDNYRFTVLILICYYTSNLLYFVEAKHENYYQACETRISRELRAFKEHDLRDEVRLTRVADLEAGSSFFFPYGRVQTQNQLFRWNGVNETSADDIIVIGVANKSSRAKAYSNMWMSSAFTALKKMNEPIPTKNPNIVINHFYALVAYARKDLPGSGKIRMEWDRWSSKIVKYRDTETEAASSETETLATSGTLLCLYGSCACASCKCAKMDASERDNGGPGMYEDSTEVEAGSSQVLDEDEEYTVVSSFASSKHKNAYSSAISNANGETRSAAEAENGTAVAEAITKEGSQSLAASRGKNALSEAEAGSNGDATALAVGKRGGFSQSSAQSRGGGVEAKAVSRGDLNWTQPAIGGMHYDEVSDDIDDDPMKLLRDTEKAFLEASARSHSAKAIKKTSSADDLCIKETSYELNITIAEDLLLARGRAHRNGTTSQWSVLEYGLDVDIQVNSTVLVASTFPGFFIHRKSCCDLPPDISPVLMHFLKKIKQDCLGGFRIQASRITNSSMDSRLRKILKTVKLSKEQHQDLLPLVLLKMYDDKKTFSKSVRFITQAFQEAASEEVHFIAALIINAAHFGRSQGRLHKVKIWKGLAANLKSVWIGLLLEFKKCKMGPAKCVEDTVEKLKSEIRLILGVYIFLKFPEGRWGANAKSKGLPVEQFIDFYKQHTMAISKLAFCKSRRSLSSSQTSAGET